MKNNYKTQQKRLQKEKKRQKAIKSSGGGSGHVKKYGYDMSRASLFAGALGTIGGEIYKGL